MADTHRRAKGIPYATLHIEGNTEVKTCPRCGLRIKSMERKDSESYSDLQYRDHYFEEHAVDDGYIVIDGALYEAIETPPKPQAFHVRTLAIVGLRVEGMAEDMVKAHFDDLAREQGLVRNLRDAVENTDFYIDIDVSDTEVEEV